jgi:hypothetical protein
VFRQQYEPGRTPEEDHYVASISKKIKEAAMHAAKDRLSGSKHGGRSGSGADKAKSVLKSFLK